jgi:hypothetical protein
MLNDSKKLKILLIAAVIVLAIAVPVGRGALRSLIPHTQALHHLQLA